MTQSLVIRPVEARDRAGWDPLWAGYLKFYRARLDPAITESTWSRLLAPDEQPIGLVAESAGTLVGLAHMTYHRSTWAITNYLYLEDLFALPAVRGQGVGRRLIDAVYAHADAAGAARVYWMTQEFNAEARRLYETVAKRSSFVQYRR